MHLRRASSSAPARTTARRLASARRPPLPAAAPALARVCAAVARGVARHTRRLHVFATAALVFCALKLAQMVGLAEERRWDALHRWCAGRLLRLAMRRGGLWVKCCQYVASRGDVLPGQYVEVLGGCLDDCPPDEEGVVWRIVDGEVRRACGKGVEDVFEGFDAGRPIASASVAQVHRARLRCDGREVVLKVQHPSIGEYLMADLNDLYRVLELVKMSDPEFDMSNMLSAWLEMVPKETDFLCEMANVQEVRAILEAAKPGLQTRSCVPKPIEELSTPRLFVMEFVDGCKVTDHQALDAAGVNREVLVEEISRAFALMVTAGRLHGDMHPGNIMVDDLANGGRPVLLDFGICVPLDEPTRLGFARLLVAAAENDSYSLLQSFADMGVELNRADPVASMELVNFLLRSTVPRDQTIAETSEFRDNMLSHRDRMAEGSSTAGGIAVDRRATDSSVSTFPAPNDSQNALGTVDKQPPSAPSSPQVPPPSSSSSSTALSEDAHRRPLVDSYPGHIIFFLRTLACLRGLATSLGVQHAYLPVLAHFARSTLHDACPPSARIRELVYKPTREETAARAASGAPRPPRSLESRRGRRVRYRLEKAFEMLADADLMVGVQVAVYHRGELIVDMSAGQMGRHNPRPMRSDSVVNGFGASEALVAVLLAQAQDEHDIDYDGLVGDHWPEYAVAGKEKTTVGDLLSHGTGLYGVVPPDMSMLRLRDDRDGIVKHLERAEPVHPPGTVHVHRFYDLNFGWLGASFLERVSGSPFPVQLAKLTSKLGIGDECFCGNLPDELVPDVTSSRVASLHNGILGDLELFTGASKPAAGRSPTQVPTASQTPLSTGTLQPVRSVADVHMDADAASLVSEDDHWDRTSVGSATDASSVAAMSSTRSAAASTARPKMYQGPPNTLELARSAIESLSMSLTSDEHGEAGDLDDLNALPPYLLEPSYFNHPVMRDACVPSANAHFSARALARLYAALANDGEVGGVRILRKGRVAEMMTALYDSGESVGSSSGSAGPAEGSCSEARPGQRRERVAYGAGLRLYDVVRKSGRVQQRAAIGCSGLGGTMAFAIPGEHKLAVAVTVNKLNVVSAASALAVHVACQALGAPVPMHIANLERKAREVQRGQKGGDIISALKGAMTTSDFAQALMG